MTFIISAWVQVKIEDIFIKFLFSYALFFSEHFCYCILYVFNSYNMQWFIVQLNRIYCHVYNMAVVKASSVEINDLVFAFQQIFSLLRRCSWLCFPVVFCYYYFYFLNNFILNFKEISRLDSTVSFWWRGQNGSSDTLPILVQQLRRYFVAMSW